MKYINWTIYLNIRGWGQQNHSQNVSTITILHIMKSELFLNKITSQQPQFQIYRLYIYQNSQCRNNFFACFYVTWHLQVTYSDRNFCRSVCRSLFASLALSDKLGRLNLAGVSGTRPDLIRNSLPQCGNLGGGEEWGRFFGKIRKK